MLRDVWCHDSVEKKPPDKSYFKVIIYFKTLKTQDPAL